MRCREFEVRTGSGSDRVVIDRSDMKARQSMIRSLPPPQPGCPAEDPGPPPVLT